MLKSVIKTKLYSICGELILGLDVKPDPQKIRILTQITSQHKHDQIFLHILNYLRKYSPLVEDMCEILRKLTSIYAD